ncbi:MAG TPA: type 4a pilus biogenesis protein PilO [Gallionellaceae bacterium]|nr:type 4a pilus biogenesis protein PilO [Gallionellaceae bacterium]
MNNILDQIRNVNPKTPGSWPLPIKLGALALMLVGVVLVGAVLDWQDGWDTLSTKREEENRLKEDYLVKKKQAVNLDLIKKQLIETQQSFGALLKQLPTKSEMAALLTDINQAGLGRGLLFELFRPGPEVATGVFTEQPITIKVTGSYDDLGKFSSDISMMPRIVTLNDISISPATGGQLVMDAIAKTYRYLDEDEMSAQKKPAGAKK